MSSIFVLVLLICACTFEIDAASNTRNRNSTTVNKGNVRTIGKHDEEHHGGPWSVIKEPITHLAAGLLGNKFGYHEDHCEHIHKYPIDLPADAKIASYGKLQFNGFQWTYTGKLTYEKRHLELYLKHDDHLTVTGGGLKGVYSLRKIRFYSPSKLTVVGASYIGEIHFICDRIHHSHGDGGKDYDDTAVFVVFVMIGSDDNLAYDAIKHGMKHISEEHTDYEFEQGISPGAFLPNDRCTFFRFHARYPRKSCDKAAIWSVLMEPIQISVHQYGHTHETHGPDHDVEDEDEPQRYQPGKFRTLELDGYKSRSRRIITVQPRIFCKSPISYKDGFPWYLFHKSSK